MNVISKAMKDLGFEITVQSSSCPKSAQSAKRVACATRGWSHRIKHDHISLIACTTT